MLPWEYGTLIGPHNLKSSCSSKSLTTWSRVDQNNSVNNSYYLESARDFSSSRSIISLREAWYKVRPLANFVETDRDSWHSLATLAILAGCRESIVSRSPIVNSSWWALVTLKSQAQPASHGTFTPPFCIWSSCWSMLDICTFRAYGDNDSEREGLSIARTISGIQNSV
jgi:hypothetical protein